MIELSRHIESLMLKHDCVIVPGLGGFVTQYVPARRVADEQLFLPPCRSVGFNPQLTLNDGLLVQSYMQAYDTNYPETLKLINDAVARLKEQLQAEGVYELSGIGKLTLGIGGRYDFTPCEAGVLSPELYGLDALPLAEVGQTATDAAANEAEVRPKKKKVHLKRTEKDYTLSISRELVNYVAAAAVAVFFYLLWATPISSSSPTEPQSASVVYEQLFAPERAAQQTGTPQNAAPQRAETNKATDAHTLNLPAAAAQPQPTTQQATAPTPQPQAEAQPAPAPAPEAKPAGRYTLVLASAISANNAETYARQLRHEGLAEAEPYKRGRMVRVIYGHYANEREAQNALAKLRSHQAFADAWVLETK